MGNSPTKPEEEEEEPPSIPSSQTQGDYEWPISVYDEASDLAEASFLIYMFARLIYVVRAHEQEFNENGGDAEEHDSVESISAALKELESSIDNGSVIMRKFTPRQIETIVKNHFDYLKSSENFDMNPQSLLDSLAKLIERVPADQPNALTLHDYDDIYQTDELVYAIGKDDIKKRITLILRGTESHSGSAWSNWATNLSVWKTEVPVPPITKEALEGGPNSDMESLWIHSGFYNYVYATTKNEKDEADTTKFDEIVQQLKILCEENPGICHWTLPWCCLEYHFFPFLGKLHGTRNPIHLPNANFLYKLCVSTRWRWELVDMRQRSRRGWKAARLSLC